MDDWRKIIRYDRHGAVPPKTRGGLAFLLHMLAVPNAGAGWAW